ncbi:heavy-metal-associated domain-containing protein [Streptomyces scopuliridis]|uniref:Heavy-metal-associated domain-containing protein n=1 Tax=Streptomyces scopuliridis TaxID=452529 RepID=A0ACD4ZVG7_9ACTN|nr:heavy metal-associated domain-containing protein [Streptomyces scopuliridis]WSC01812.1 heavy-metal-associated domain-containing protein [Streptomyces scopuliridis]WSC04651.1 heavy-metal-associated domain-containing protein [Streptomyces scopuliridis]
MSDCCTPDGSCSTNTAQGGTTVVADSHTVVYAVAGMTCGHCKSTLTKAIGGLDGVLKVDVDLATGHVSVTTDGESDDAEIAKAVDDAGYEVTGRAT